jgi:hypothetical protein
MTGTLKVVLVPVRYDADGTGRLPDLSQGQLQRYQDILMAYYPTASVALSVRDAVSTDISLRADTGWSSLLDAVRELRVNDGALGDVYYYGLVSPAASFSIYCRSACTAGLSYLAEVRSPSRQVGLGVGFSGVVSADTLVHEMGHQHGRMHAPCGAAAGVDGAFPHPDGGIGTWGFDFRSMQLQSPMMRKDLMGYCTPQWISDYSYAALANRRNAISGAAAAGPPERLVRARGFRALLVGPGGTRWGRPVAAGEEIAGRPEPARVLDAAGAVIAEVTVYRTEHGHGGGALLMVPPAAPGWAAIALGDGATMPFSTASAVPALQPLRAFTP